MAWSADGSLVLSDMDAAGFDVRELFAATPDGTSFTLLSGPLVFGGQVVDFAPR